MSMGHYGMVQFTLKVILWKGTHLHFMSSLPQNYMFKEMRGALGIPKSVDILDHIRSLSNEPDDPSSSPTLLPQSHSSANPSDPPSEDTLVHTTSVPDPPKKSPQGRAVAKVQNIERTAMTSQRPQPGLQELMAYLTSRGIPKALCTRNFPAPVHHLLDNFLPGEVFEPIITRETEGIQPKPSPEGLWMIAQAWGIGQDMPDLPTDVKQDQVDPLELAKRHLGTGMIMVGDSIDDISAGRRAGAATVLLANDENKHLVTHEYTDLSVRRLDELIDILEKGFEAHK